MPILPEYVFSAWLLVALPAVWLVCSLVHQEIKRKNIAANLIFGPVDIETSPLIDQKTLVLQDTIYIFRTSVRNSPINMEEGRSVENAHITADFFTMHGERKELQVDFARWTDNPNPQLGGGHGLRFLSDWNFRTLAPNNAANGIDFAIGTESTRRLFGFRGASQETIDWQEPMLRLKNGAYRVRLTIQGKGLDKPASEWLVIRNCAPPGDVSISFLRDEEWKNWIGVG